MVKTTEGHDNGLATWNAFEDPASNTYLSGPNNDVFTFTGNPVWDGFYNTQTGMYPLIFSNGGTINFTASVPNGGSATVYFRFEKNPYPDIYPLYNTVTKTINGSTPTEYTINIPPQGSNTFRSFIFYIVESNTPVRLQNLTVIDDSTVAGVEEFETLSPELITEISWPSLNGVEYDIMESSNLVNWSDFGTDVIGDGGTQTIIMTMDQASRFIRVIEPE